MRKLCLALIVVALVLIGADEYAHRQLINLPGLRSARPERVIHQRMPKLKAPGDASRETRQVLTKKPIRYHGYFNSKNKSAYLSRIQQVALRDINAERAKRHLPALRMSRRLNQVAGMRAAQANRKFSHYTGSGQALGCIDAVKTHLMPSYAVARTRISECLSEQAGDVDNTADQVAHTAIKGMIYHDATSHWGHRKILLDRGNRSIGISAYVDRAEDNKVVVAYELDR